MHTRFYKPLLLILLTGFLAGCATTRAQRPDEKSDLESQVASLQNEVRAKDQEIQDLQDQLQSQRQSLSGPVLPSAKEDSHIRVAGVTVKDIQKALVRAGFDPGPVDGRLGKKTKRAVRDFQKKNGLKTDGIVGEKTWALLKAS